MKHIYALATALLVGGSIIAQGVMPAVQNKAERVRDNQGEILLDGEREIFWTNDFSNCDDWAIDNAYDNGYTQFVEGLDFECGDVEPTGPAAIAGLNSTTASNGVMMVDSDEFGGADGGTGIENNWFQSVGSINCADHEFVSISFETYYYMWDNGSSDGNEYCLVEVSRDGVTWPDIETFEVSEGNVDFGDGDGEVQARWECWPDMATQDPVDNPTLMVFDLTAAAGGQEVVYLRFRWKGTWGYSWIIDDIQMYDTPANDVRISTYASYTDYNTTNMYENGAWPESQLVPLDVAATVRNMGYNDQEAVDMSVTVNGVDAGTSDAIALAYQADDTLRVLGVEIAGGLGAYEIGYSMNIMDDENPADNTLTQSFEVTETSYGRDNGTVMGAFPFDGADDFIGCALYQIFGDATVYAIDVAVLSGSEEGTPVIAHLFDGTSDDFLGEQYGGLLVSSDEVDLIDHTNDVGDDEIVWYTMLLEEPVSVADGDFVGAGFEHYGGSNLQIGESKDVQDQTCFVYGPFGSGGAYDWYYTNESPMVRLNLDENAEQTMNVEEIGAENFAIFPAVPNPAESTTRLQFRLDQVADVNVSVRDITGKLVFSQEQGTLAIGYHSQTLDVSVFESGIYMLTLLVNGERATQQLIVR